MKSFFKIAALLLFLGLSTFKTAAQSNPADRPRLVVGIMVDGLQQRHIDRLWSYFEPNGLKKIISQGKVCNNVSYNAVSGGNTSDIATVMTGSVPFYHGISGDFFYDKTTEKVQSTIADDEQIGIGTTDKVSAHNLLSGTFTDELMMAYPEKAKCFAVGIDAGATIMMGGHTANSVAWIDDIYLKWVTTGYFQDGLPEEADQMNVDGTFKNLASRLWKPMYAINTYVTSQGNRQEAFSYNPTDRKTKGSSSTLLKRTPAANTLVAELAGKIVENEKLGVDNVPDALMLQFTVRAPNEKFFSLQSPEKEDMYLRLDRDIQTLLKKIDEKVGLSNTLVYLYSNQTDVHSPSELGDNHIPAGYFSANRSMALVNTYLMALYGQERWITGYYAKNIYLNKAKIEEKKLNLRQFQQTVADFMLEFAGVQSAYPASQVLTMPGNSQSDANRLRNSYNKSTIGDVVITLMPGWLEVDEKLQPVGESNAIITYTPLYFYGWQIKQGTVKESYQVTDIAPTISRILNIPMPNACIGKPMKEIVE
ncbi:MAG: alkaline phosphatase family protein [Paludibacter sp.]|nr:alkaline phosphatase family protein [Paludibacter sp.]